MYRLEMEGREVTVTMGLEDGGRDQGPKGRIALPESLALMALSAGRTPQSTAVSGLGVLADSRDSLDRLSQVVIYQRGPGGRWRLPGERLAKVLGLEVEERQSGAWALAAYDRRAVDLGERQLGWLEASVGPQAPSALRFAAWVDLHRTQGLFLELEKALDALPLPDRRETRLFAAAGLALRSLSDFRFLSLRILEDPAGFELRLHSENAD